MHSTLPKDLLISLEGVPGFDATGFEAVHAQGRQVTSIRLNPAKWSGKVNSGDMARGADMVKAAVDSGVTPFAGSRRVPWSSYGYYLPERPSFTFDPLFHAGVYYVQEASSMFLEEAVRQTVDLSRPLRVLDLCAAPGGKSTLLQSLLSPDSLLVSNEVIRGRVGVLHENMVKWGGVGVVVTNNDPRDFRRLENYFDVIVVDAPCSGSGLLRREPEAAQEWSLGNVQLCQQRQQRILADCWPALRQGGRLIYSTCSYSREEDEDILDWMGEDLPAEGLRLQTPESWNIIETVGKKGAYGYRFFPDRLEGEGFFITVLEKKDGGDYATPRKRAFPEKVGKKDEDRIRGWIREDKSLFFFLHQQEIHVFPESLAADIPILQSSCHLKSAGVRMGRLTAKEFLPEHDLALSCCIHPELPALHLSREEAIRYLRKEEIRPEGGRVGWTLVQFEGHNLGWVKILSNRVNNYYPKEWRILKR